MIEQEQNANEIEHNAYVSINTALRQSVRSGFKMRSSPLLRHYLKQDIATLRMVQSSILLAKKIK